MSGGAALIWCVVAAISAEPVVRPQLVFDAGGHTAAVNKVRFLDNERIVSVSSDKTIRIWGIRSGETLDVLRTPIQEGQGGALYAIAVSGDGRWVAVGGYEFAGQNHAVYLIDMREQRLAAAIRGHTNVILDLAFSANGRLLASASADKTVRLWDVSSFQGRGTLRGHRDSVYAVAFSPDDEQLASASLDGTARIWSVPRAAEVSLLRGQEGPLQAVAWSPDGRSVATGSADQSINIWSPRGQLRRRLERLGNHVTSLSFCGDSERLFFTLGGGGDRDGGFLVDLSSNRPRVSFTAHGNSVLDGSLSPDGSLAATADADGEIHLWRTRDGSQMQRFGSHGRRAWSVAWDRQSGTIVWGNKSDYVSPNQRGPLEFAFQSRELEFAPLGTQLQRAQTRIGALAVEQTDATTLMPRRSGRDGLPLKLPTPLDQIRCFTLLDPLTVAVGSDFGLLLADTATGRWQRQLKGHAGAVWSVAPSIDGRYLLSSADDQSLRVWDWKNGHLLLSFFFADRQWIAWTPEGYYAASPGGERLMGWHVNNGPAALASFYPAARFRSSLYRPDLIRRLLDAGSVQAALAETASGTDRSRDITTVDEVLPPVVQITEPSSSPYESEQSQLIVRATAEPRGHPVTALRLLLDGRPYEGRKGLQVVPSQPQSLDKVSGEWTVELAPGQHALIVQAETPVSSGTSPTAQVLIREAVAISSTRPPDLFVLAIGVADYPGRLQLNYAASDAEVLAGTLQKFSSPLFREVKVRLLTNQQATRRDILQGLSWLRREMTQRDVTVVFFSGHGAKDDTGNFYLVPIDGEPSDLLSSGVSGSQFKDALAAIPGRVLVLLDACHAGAAGGDQRKAVYVLTDDLIRDLATDDFGVIVMCSSMGREYSMESDEHKQGYFTMALIEALEGLADYNQDGLIYLTEIDGYLSDRVKQLTQGQQHPVTTKPTTIRSFPISRVSKDEE